jgi:hypothetical protein
MSMRSVFLAVRGGNSPPVDREPHRGVFVYVGILQRSLDASGTSTPRGVLRFQGCGRACGATLYAEPGGSGQLELRPCVRGLNARAPTDHSWPRSTTGGALGAAGCQRHTLRSAPTTPPPCGPEGGRASAKANSTARACRVLGPLARVSALYRTSPQQLRIQQGSASVRSVSLLLVPDNAFKKKQVQFQCQRRWTGKCQKG